MFRARTLITMTAALVLAGFVLPGYAAQGGHGGGGGGEHPTWHAGPDTHFDARHHHNQYYPTRGYVAAVPPHGGYPVTWHGAHYWYGGGVWWGPHAGGWAVVGGEIGVLLVMALGGIPYYYANDAYYVWHDTEHGYEVVDPPGGAASTEPPAPDDVYMYPRNGQSPDQQARDRYECHHWAVEQTGFDPTRPDGGVAPGDARTRRSEYFRAMSACLEGRGYSVK